MMGDADAVRFMLRAELQCAGQTLVSSASELTEETVFVTADWHPPLGAEVSLRLSFPTLFEPVELAARVARHRAYGAPGELGGIELVFEATARPAAATLVTQIRRLLASTGTPPTEDAPFRVLLVEDSRLIRDMFAFGMRRSFQTTGALEIDHAENAVQAWSKLSEASYDLVIVDYFLPEDDGASLIARMRQDERLSRVPVVAISVGGPIARDATIAAGADLFLDKPLVLRDLLHTMRALARRQRSPDAGRRPAVLVLDDSPLVLAVTRFALEGAGFEVAVAEDLKAFERLRTAVSPDLILIDVQMPEAFGDDVASTLRGWHGVRAPILLVSSLQEPELARRASVAQAAGYVLKEAGMSALVNRCKELVGSAA